MKIYFKTYLPLISKLLIILIVIISIQSCQKDDFIQPTFLELKTIINEQNDEKLSSIIKKFEKQGISFYQEYDVNSLLRLAIRHSNEKNVDQLLNTIPEKNIFNEPGFIKTIHSVDKDGISENYKNLIYKNINIPTYEDFLTVLGELIEERNSNLFRMIINQHSIWPEDIVSNKSDSLKKLIENIIEKNLMDYFEIIVNSNLNPNWELEINEYWNSLAKQPIEFIDFVYKLTNSDINYVSNNGSVFLSSILHRQNDANTIPYISHLIANGADPTIGDFAKFILRSSPESSIETDKYLFSLLVENNFNFNSSDNEGNPYIFLTLSSNAALEYYNGQEYFYNQLKDQVNLHITDSHDNNLVHKAVVIGKLDILKELIEVYDVSIDHKNSWGSLPIEISVTGIRLFNEDIFIYLRDNGSKLSDDVIQKLKLDMSEFLETEKINELFQGY